MAKKLLDLRALGEFDGGRLASAFDLELAKVVHDLSDKPGDTTARKLILQIDFSPVAPSGVIDDVKVGIQVHAKVPSQKSRTYSMTVRAGERLMFNDESADNAKQGTLDELDDRKGK